MSRAKKLLLIKDPFFLIDRKVEISLLLQEDWSFLLAVKSDCFDLTKSCLNEARQATIMAVNVRTLLVSFCRGMIYCEHTDSHFYIALHPKLRNVGLRCVRSNFYDADDCKGNDHEREREDAHESKLLA